MTQVDLSAHAQIGARLETLVGDGQSVRAVVAWLSNGEAGSVRALSRALR